jgi:hypothetical protein
VAITIESAKFVRLGYSGDHRFAEVEVVSAEGKVPFGQSVLSFGNLKDTIEDAFLYGV